MDQLGAYVILFFRTTRRKPLFPRRPYGFVDKDGDAVVTPSQLWSDDGSALVAPAPPLILLPRTLPLDHLVCPFTVYRSEYGSGLVCIPEGGGPQVSPATLPIIFSSGNSVQVAGDGFVDWPDGLVIWFS
jgi:hypothetical protein